MNHNRYRFLLVLVSVVIAITLAIQFYWVFKNYEESKRQLQRDIQTSFDLTVADYFTSTSKKNTVGFLSVDGKFPSESMNSLIDSIVLNSKSYKAKTSPNFKTTEFIEIHDDSIKSLMTDRKSKIKQLEIFKNSDNETTSNDKSVNSKLKSFFNVRDSIEIDSSVSITNLSFTDDKFSGKLDKIDKRFTFSYSTNSIDLESMDSLMDLTLEKNDIQINNGFKYNDGEDDFEIGNISGDQFIESNSPQLYKNTKLEMVYSGQEKTLFKRNLAGISLSFVLISGVIFCLFYMLYIIRKQKELSMIKNDLISNITHEFKTPIATACAALEGVQNFTGSGDIDKSNRYLGIGRDQLSKLNLMVEKLLETATIDSERLALQKTRVSINSMLQEVVERFQSQTVKQINFSDLDKDILIYADEFHLENAINNLVDNAIKYGGDSIELLLKASSGNVTISVRDNGKQLTTRNSKNIFDKFYRVPTGNKHNIKGYGIGLYYTRAIVEKHGGSISLDLKPTQFTIELPHE